MCQDGLGLDLPGLGLDLHCCIDIVLFWSRGVMQTCPASMAYDNQRIRDVVDDAVELDVATKMVVGGLGLEGWPTLQTARHWGSQI